MAFTPSEIQFIKKEKEKGRDKTSILRDISKQRQSKQPESSPIDNLTGGKPKGLSVSDVLMGRGGTRDGSLPSDRLKTPGFVSKARDVVGRTIKDVPNDLREMGGNISTTLNKARQTGIEAADRVKRGEQTFGEGLFQTLGGAASGAAGVIGEGFMTAGKLALTDEQEKAISQGFEKQVGKVLEKPQIQSMVSSMQKWAQENPREAANLKAAGGFASLLLEVATAGAGGRAVGVGKEALKETGELALEQGGRMLRKGAAGVESALEQGRNKLTTGAGVLEESLQNIKTPELGGITEKIGRFGERVKTNIDEARNVAKEIESLPSEPAKTAVREGVDIVDVRDLYSIPKDQKPNLRKLTDRIVNFAKNKTGLNPIQEVGKPIVKKLKTLRKEVSTLGSRLDDVAKNLKGKAVNQADEAVQAINQSIDNVGARITEDGIDFVGSNFEGVGTIEKTINNVYKRILNAQDAADWHRLKKFIDNNVDFGKTSGGLTGEAERLLKSWRRTADEMLDAQFAEYNKVNTLLSQKLQPITDLRKVLKDAGIDTDLLEMKAGLLARRLASNAASNPTIRQILRNLDKATSVGGKVGVSTEELINHYLRLEKYFPEIIGKATFKGGVQGGIDVGLSIPGLIAKGVSKVTGRSEAVLRKAIIDVLKDALK